MKHALPLAFALCLSLQAASAEDKLTLTQLRIDLVDPGLANNPRHRRNALCRARLSNDGKGMVGKLHLKVALQNWRGEELRSWQQDVASLEPGHHVDYVSPFYNGISSVVLQMTAVVSDDAGNVLAKEIYIPPDDIYRH